MKIDPNYGHHESCACLRPGDAMCNCGQIYDTPPAHGDGEGDARAEFERWVAKRWGYSTERWADSGEYLYQNTRDWWQCWQAALTTRPTPEAQEARDAARYRHMRDRNNSLERFQRDKDNGASCYHVVGGVRELKSGDELDAAIDAAIELRAHGGMGHG